MKQSLENEPHALYRHYNSKGDLLYIGISLSCVDRLARHVRNSSWAYEISRIDITWMKNRKAALLAENNAIHDESPRHNKFHNTNICDNNDPLGWVDTNRFYDDSGSIVFDLKESMVEGLGYFSRCKVKWSRPPTSKTGLLLASVISSRNWENKKCSIDINELRKILNIEGKYIDFGSMKAKLLSPAIIEVESCSNVKISYEEIKNGRKVLELRFKFICNKQNQENKNDNRMQ